LGCLLASAAGSRFMFWHPLCPFAFDTYVPVLRTTEVASCSFVIRPLTSSGRGKGLTCVAALQLFFESMIYAKYTRVPGK